MLASLAKQPLGSVKVPPKEIKAFRQRHRLTAEEMDDLFGFTSGGRSTRRWEKEDAPGYVRVLMGYFDKFGLDEARKIAWGKRKVA